MRLERTGKTATLLGSQGPPVLFSPGLFGTMPRQIYTDFLRALARNVTVVVVDGADAVTAPVVDDVARTLAVDRVAFVSHSSFDARILLSDRVGAAVLCDPVVLPSYDWAGGWVPPETSRVVKILRAGLAYDGTRATPIPDFLSPGVAPESPTRVFDGVGHADLLDDRWAEAGARALPFMKGMAADPDPVRFEDWSRGASSSRPSAAEGVRARRRAYRDEVAAEVLRWVAADAGPRDGADPIIGPAAGGG